VVGTTSSDGFSKCTIMFLLLKTGECVCVGGSHHCHYPAVCANLSWGTNNNLYDVENV